MDHLEKILSTLKHLDLDGEIEQREHVQVGFGGSCDVFKAWSKKHKQEVAVKRVRVFLGKDERFARKLAKEIRIWASLEHDCVLPFLGYFVEGKDAMPSLISLWMANGTLDDYMENFPRGGEDTRAMLGWISHGLSYLHSRDVIHGDLKSKNILISDDRKPLLADFGLSNALSFTKSSSTTTSPKGTVRWMAIELFNSEPPVHTPATDVWSYGMVGYELLSGSIPYGDKPDHRVPSLILEGKRPDRPETERQLALFDPLWELCETCWNKNAEKRPVASQLSDKLNQMANLIWGSDSEVPVMPYGFVSPLHGRNYFIVNVGRELWLDLARGNVTDGSFVIGWHKAMPANANQIWNFCGSANEFTLQNIYLLKEKGIVGGNNGGPEGHLRIDKKKTVIGPKPQKWKLELVGNNIYKIHPVKRSKMSLTSVTDQLIDWKRCQVALASDAKNDENQQWIFIEAPITPYGSVDPIDGRNYHVVNVGRERWLDLAGNDPTEGNFVIGFFKNTPPTANQIWNFSGTSDDFTLQNLFALQEKGIFGGNDGGSEGHLRIETQIFHWKDKRGKRTVIGSKPFNWKLERVVNNFYRIHPANDLELSLTCLTEANSSPGSAAQLQLTRDKDETQLWAFLSANKLI